MNNKLELFNKFFNPEKFEVNSNIVEEIKILSNTEVSSLQSNAEEDRLLSTPDNKLTKEELIKKAELVFQ